jgi:ABC-type glycerol-3-phosphate transport system substrate-binding protein
MDENVIFDNTQPSPEVPAQEQGGAPSITDPNAAAVVPDSIAPSGNGLKKKLIIGIIILFIVIFLIFLLIPKGKAEKDVKLVWWGLWEDSNVMQEIINDFHKTHPHITIEYIKEDPSQYQERLLAHIKTGDGPDIFRFHNTWYPMLSSVLAPLSSDVITPSEFQKVFYPVMQKDLTQNGAIYGIPMGADCLALFVNTDMFEKAGYPVPTNWVEFQKVAIDLTSIDKDTNKIVKSGAAMGTYANITHAPDIIALLFAQKGIDMKNFANSAANQSDALQFYLSFSQNNKSPVWNSDVDESWLAFSRGNLAMYFGYSWDVFRILEQNKDLSFKIYPVPGNEGSSNTTIASYWVEGVSNKSLNQKEALAFMHYLAQKETAQKFYTNTAKTRKFGEPYARVDLADTVKQDPFVYPFVTQLKNASSLIFASDTHDGENGINSTANNYLKDAINGIIMDNKTIETVTVTLDSGIAQIMQKYGSGQ